MNGRVCQIRELDFGHWVLNIEDIIQNKIQFIWNVGVFPLCSNLCAFKPTYFVAIGIGLLNFDNRSGTKGPLSECLRKGLRFLPERMQVTLPPLPP